MAASGDIKLKQSITGALGSKMVMVAFGSLVTLAGGKMWSCSQGAVATLAEAKFETTEAHAKERSLDQDEYRALANDEKNTAAQRYQELGSRINALSADVSFVKNWLIQADRAPSGTTFHRGKREP